MFWPEGSQKQANASLRNALSSLRRLPGEHLAITRQAIALKRQTVWVDVDQFEALLKRTGDRTADALQSQAAVSMYRGDFLQGFHVAGAPGFEQWMAIKREHLREAMLAALLALAEWHAGQRDYAASLDHLTHLLSLEPASEAGHRQKMAASASGS